MSIYYVDSSAWIKRYFLEGGSQAIEELFERSGFLACSMLGRVEVAATIVRKRKAGELKHSDHELIQHRLQLDWGEFHQMPLTGAVLLEVDRALAFALRGADAIHLASVLYLKKQFASRQDVVLVCSDKALNEAAIHLNVTVMDPVALSHPL